MINCKTELGVGAISEFKELVFVKHMYLHIRMKIDSQLLVLLRKNQDSLPKDLHHHLGIE